MTNIWKGLAFLIYWAFGFFVVGGLLNYSTWGLLAALPMGLFLGATWYNLDVTAEADKKRASKTV
jgi:hypothetical protein